MKTKLPYTLELHAVSKNNPKSRYILEATAFKGCGQASSIYVSQRV